MIRSLLAYLVVLSSVAVAQAKRPFTFEDMMALKRVNEPIISPDGKWVAFSAVDVNLEKNTKTLHLWIVPASGGDAKQLTSGPGEDRPRWSPDGKKLAFVSDRDGAQQVWTWDFDSTTASLPGQPAKITSLSTGADGEIWSPDGSTILFTSEVFPECTDDACNKAKTEAQAKLPKAQIWTHLFYRHWSTYNLGKRTHLFVVPAGGGVARDLTPGEHDARPFSLGGQDMYAFSPDGKEVAFTSNIDEVPATSTNNEVFLVPTAGGTPKKISTSPGSDSTPLYSPDGKLIAWRMQKRAGYESDRFRLVIYNRQTGEIKNLTENFDRWVGSFTWAPDSTRLYFVAEDKGEAPLYMVPIGGDVVQKVSRGFFDSPTLTFNGIMFANCMSIQAPNEICSLDLGGGFGQSVSKQPSPPIPERALNHLICLVNPDPSKEVPNCAAPLTHLNDAVLSQLSMSPIESFWFTGANKTKVQGFLLKPPNFDANKKYPVKLLIHGGPQGAWGDDWSFRWNPELFAANGYVVVMINPRGSTGYGQKFIDEINGDWGGKPFIDLMKGLDYAEQKYPFIDKNRECALGASYGGYMVDWILGHTDRFKCLVSHDGMFDTISAFGTTEELWFPLWEFQGTPWTNRKSYDKWSPSNYATRFKTPTLVVHGQLDYRLDVSEGLQLFTYLQLLKIPSKMLYFPDEGHWVLKPQNSRLWYQTVNGWVDQHAGQ
jgi:dipeptidyl aminopeptidase/acylaminoacyl peptidase